MVAAVEVDSLKLSESITPPKVHTCVTGNDLSGVG